MILSVKDESVGQRRLLDEIVCPFFAVMMQKCQVMTGRVEAGVCAKSICKSDDYDCCPRYLAYLLRRTRPNRVDHDWLDAI